MSQSGAMSLLVALAVICGASTAFGQDSGGGGQSEDRYVFDEMQVFGEIDKPEAFYILRASSLDYENIEPVESFLDEMYESAKESPF
jgi:hypothetical protein